MNRAYWYLDVKSFDEDTRTFEGIASTPEVDRMGDIVEPKGAKYTLPIPMMWQHGKADIDHPVGWITDAKLRKDGIVVKGKFASLDGPPTLKEALDKAWALVKSKLVRGLSIGFNPLDAEPIKDSFGLRYTSWEWLELSPVAIAANAGSMITTFKSMGEFEASLAKPEATILNVKSSDVIAQAAFSQSRSDVVSLTRTVNPAGVSAQPKRVDMTNKERISQWEAKLTADTTRMTELMTKADEAGVTLDAKEDEEYDTLKAEVAQITKHLGRAREHETMLAATAKPVTPENTATPEKASETRGGAITVNRVAPPKGTNYARYAMALMACKGSAYEAAQMAKQNWPDFPEIQAMIENPKIRDIVHKAAIEPGTTTATTWAEPLVPNAIQMAGEFLEMLRPMTLVGRIPGLRRVPVNIEVPRQTGTGTFGWVGEKQAKPVTSLAFDSVTLRWNKIAGIIVLTKELVKYSNPSAEAIVRDSMIKDTAIFQDQQFIDPTVAVNGNISPASITNGATTAAAGGTTAAFFRSDMATALGVFLTANQDPSKLVVLMSAKVAMNLSLLVNTLGQQEFPTVGMEGGTILGMPVVVSQTVGARIVLINASEILLNDDGGVEIDASEQASVVMTDTPEASPAATSLVSLWQRNEVGLRIDRWVTWIRGRSTSVYYISNAVYSG